MTLRRIAPASIALWTLYVVLPCTCAEDGGQIIAELAAIVAPSASAALVGMSHRRQRP